MSDVSSPRTTQRRSDWFIALAMIVGGSLPTAAWIWLASAAAWNPWVVVPVGGLIAIVGGLAGGVLALESERG